MDTFIRLIYEDHSIIFLKREYITAYCYDQQRDVTKIWILGESKEWTFPGDQTERIIQ